MRYIVVKIGTTSSQRVLHMLGRLKIGNTIYVKYRGESYWDTKLHGLKVNSFVDGWLYKCEHVGDIHHAEL